MKKTYLSLVLVCLCFISQAQQQKIATYEYPTGGLTEEKIQELLERGRKQGVEEEELKHADELFHKRMLKQQEDLRNGVKPASTQQTSAQKNGHNTVNSSTCVNPGFEDGTTNGWNFFSGDVTYVPLPCNSCASSATPPFTSVVNSSSNVAGQVTGGLDYYGSFSVVGSGTSSLLLNDASSGAKIAKATYTYVVDPTNQIYTFQYAAVLNSGGHAPNANPYFHVDVTDVTTGLPISCTVYDQSAPASGTLPGWNISPLCGGSACNTVYWKNWTTVSLDLSSHIGNTVTVSYIVSDCANTGHFGYVYIDGDCSNLTVTNNASICSGNNANLCGPPGYTGYNWTGPVTGSSQCLSTPTVGTYTLNMTSATSCPAPTITYTVAANPAAVPNFSVASAPCNLTATFTDLSTQPSTGSITGWTWNFGDGQTATSTTAGNVQPHTYTATGTYTVVMTCTTNAGCVGTYSTTVTLTSLPLTIATSSVACNGGSTGSATVTATGGSGSYTYSWSPTGGSGAIASGLNAGPYTCTVTGGAGCTNTISATITEATAITSTQTITPAYCNLFDGGAALTLSGGAGGYTYSWSPVGGGAPSITSAQPGTYTCYITDANACTYSTTAVINNLPGVSITSITSTSVSCYNGSNGGTSVVTNGTGVTYNWTPAGGSFPSPTNLPSGSYTVVVTDVHGCKDTASVSVANATDIVTTSTVSATPCGGSAGSATIGATGGTGAYTYSWSPVSGSGPTLPNLAAGNYNCLVTDGNGCSKNVSVFITTTTGPTVTAVSTASVTCYGLSNGSTSVTAVAGGTAPLTYTWLPGPVSTTNTANGLPAGTYTVVVQDNAGCFGSDTAVVIQPAPFSLPVVIGNTSCHPANANPSFPTLTSNGSAAVNPSGGTGALTFSWSPIGGNTNSTGPILPAGSYTCYITDANGCQTHTVAVVDNPTQLTAALSTTSVSCNPANTGNSSNGAAIANPSGGTGALQFTWSPATGTPPINNLNNTYSPVPVNTYSVHITDANNCIFDGSTTVQGPSAITASVTASTIMCNGDKGTATVTVNPSASYTYAWVPSGGSANVASNLNASTSGTGYTVTVSDLNACKTTASFVLTAPTKITGTVTATNVKCAGGFNGALSANLNNGTPGYTYTWTPGGSNAQTINNLPAGTYTLVATDANGCKFTKTKVLTSPDAVDTLQATGTLCSTDPMVTLSAPAGGAAPDDITGYQWYQGTTPITGATGSTYNATQSTIHDYSVTWYFHGCTHTTKTVVENILPDLGTLPQTNIFTPNGDNKNDEFYPFSIVNNIILPNYHIVNGMLKSYSLQVFDRWGLLMYSTTDLTKPWTGSGATDGTYYWIVNYQSNCNNTDGVKKIKGFVQLLR